MNAVFKDAHEKLYTEKKSLQEWMLFLILILPFALGLLVEVFHFPDFIRFSLDAFWLCLCLLQLINRYMVVKKEIQPLFILVLVFLGYTFFVYCFNFQSPFYYLWGLRNNFRFYVAFFSFAACINEKRAINWLKLLDVLFWINFAASLIQFLFLHVRQDYLGGLFGTTGGTNGYTIMFLSIIVGKSFLMTFNGQEKLYRCILKVVASLLIAAMAELKFYFVIFIILLVLTSFMTRISWKKLILLIMSVFAVIIGASLLSLWFDQFKNFLSLESILEAITKQNYSSGNDLNRLNSIFTLADRYVTDTVQQIFGLGLGNCDTSSLAIFNSSFYQQFSYLHYTWFSVAMLFLETGYVGLVLYFMFFVLCLMCAFKKMKKGTGNRLFCQMAIVMAILCCILTVYNSSLRIEAGYMAYFILALPFIDTQKKLE